MDDPIAVSRQRMVDDFRALAAARQDVGPSGLKRRFHGLTGFDVNCYFTVLTHLALEPGYVLDYVATTAMVPEIYARKEDEARLRSIREVWERARGRTPTPEMAYRSGNYDYLSHIQTDDSEDGFFQLIVLGIMGSQFNLYDHAQYNDSKVVCTHAALDGVVARSFAHAFADEIRREAKAFDLAPRVQMGEEDVVVSVCLFSAWGGLLKEWVTVPRAFPHQIRSVRMQALVESDLLFWF